MPALGADMEAGTLAAWRCKPGDRLERGDIIAEVETDKGIIEVEVYTPGVVERFLVEPGRKLPVGTPLAVLRDDEPAPAAQQPAAVVSVLPSAQPATSAATAQAGAAERKVPRASPSARQRARELGVNLAALPAPGGHALTAQDVERAAREAGAAGTRAGAAPATGLHAAAGSRRRVSPVARRRARELGVDLATLRGSAKDDGAIGLTDVERAAAGPGGTPGAASDRQRALRRAIAASMARAKREIPHYYLSTTADLGTASAWLDARNAERSVRERLLLGALFLKAVALAAKRMPDFNARFEDGQARPCPEVHLGVAIALRGGGLIAPAIHNADALQLGALMDALQDLVARARTGALRSSELSDGTLTVTSLGERGVESVFPIIYPPQTAIVGFGRVVQRPWVVAGAVAPRPVVTITLAADHRVTDGHYGARFLALIDNLLQEPDAL